jgi:hypothetical protein
MSVSSTWAANDTIIWAGSANADFTSLTTYDSKGASTSTPSSGSYVFDDDDNNPANYNSSSNENVVTSISKNNSFKIYVQTEGTITIYANVDNNNSKSVSIKAENATSSEDTISVGARNVAAQESSNFNVTNVEGKATITLTNTNSSAVFIRRIVFTPTPTVVSSATDTKPAYVTYNKSYFAVVALSSIDDIPKLALNLGSTKKEISTVYKTVKFADDGDTYGAHTFNSSIATGNGYVYAYEINVADDADTSKLKDAVTALTVETVKEGAE